MRRKFTCSYIEKNQTNGSKIDAGVELNAATIAIEQVKNSLNALFGQKSDESKEA